MSDELHRVLPMYLDGTRARGAGWLWLPVMVAINALSAGAILFCATAGVVLAIGWLG